MRNRNRHLKETGNRVVYGRTSIRGVITDQTCPSCGASLVYSDEYMAYCCLLCNTWLEDSCGNSECEICLTRPDTPLPGPPEGCSL
ncbi:hypothetical protein C8P63_10566 [Melghirimyces profundicolus]|uniref:Uncharacterized protein n=1 Tax=Melghirimyces profundicolus TaxID=1242148 RepID=A0A2T6C2C0_9BACL|nr:hypothetical protein [Melghirimyces profundicolus]PTX62471.1 hypothetical protein C8P63_10566 [Melghirimyces profundicolus]